MPGPIRGGGSQAANLEKLSQDLDKTADSLKQSGLKQQNEVGKVAGRDEALGKVLDSATKAYLQTSKFVEGIGDTAQAASLRAKSGSFVAIGVTGWVAPNVPAGARYVSKSTARGFSGMAESMPRLVGDLKQATVRELQADPTALRFSERMFGKAAGRLQGSADAMAAQWNAWGEALSNLASSGGNLELAAGNVASVASNLSKAAALTTSASATKMAGFGERVGAAALQAAEQGAQGARELMMASARFSAATANILANPDQAQVQLVVQSQLQQYKAELQQLARSHTVLQAFVQPLI